MEAPVAQLREPPFPMLAMFLQFDINVLVI